MANNPGARKRARQIERRTEMNKPFRTRAARTVREARHAIRTDADDAAEQVRTAQSALDRAARRNIIHPNKASRHKSRLAQQLKQRALAAA